MINVKLTDSNLLQLTEKIRVSKERAINRILFQMGAYLRTNASRSIRPSRRKPPTRAQAARGQKGSFIPADPGKPFRRAHGKLRKNMLFFVDKGTESVSVGYRDWAKEVAERQELGGTFSVKGKQKKYPARPAVFGAFENFRKDGAQQERYAHLFKHFFEKGA